MNSGGTEAAAKTCAPPLSAILPAKNEERIICKAVLSLLRQDYDPFEVIVVDDGSTDHTSAKLIERFHMRQMTPPKYPCALRTKPIVRLWGATVRGIPLLLVEKENGGKGDALNAGIRFSQGEYVVCVDADCVLAQDAFSCLWKACGKQANVVAVGGMVCPTYGLSEFLLQKDLRFMNVLQGFQELEYGLAFTIARPLLDWLGTTFLISGALGLFRKEEVVRLGGYAVDTVGEDFELVMRLRRDSAENHLQHRIGYTKEALCFTEVPWNTGDLVKQRIRWTVALTEVLRKYRSMAFGKEYTARERLTFWGYVLVEKFSPHIGFASLIVGLFRGVSKFALGAAAAVVLIQLLLSIAGSFQTLKKCLRASDRALRTGFRLLLLLLSFVSVYHIAHAFVRLIAVPCRWFQNRGTKTQTTQNQIWQSPNRM